MNAGQFSYILKINTANLDILTIFLKLYMKDENSDFASMCKDRI